MLALALAALAHVTAPTPLRPDLVARCTWAERGWQAVSAVSALRDEGALERARANLAEHARLHGWVGEIGDGHSWLIETTASCPPAALFELGRADRALPLDVTEPLARVFAENGYADLALDVLSAPGAPEGAGEASGASPARRSLARARVLADAGRWSEVLVLLPTNDAGATESELRMRALAALDRADELEALVLGRLAAGLSSGAHDCRALELLMDVWERTGNMQRSAVLPARVEALTGVPLDEDAEREVLALRDDALRHRFILGLDPTTARRQLIALLASGDHRHHVLERIETHGTDEIDALVEELILMIGRPDSSRAHTLWALVEVLAETGDQRVLPTLEVLGDEGATRPLERWHAANRLRRELEITGGD